MRIQDGERTRTIAAARELCQQAESFLYSGFKTDAGPTAVARGALLPNNRGKKRFIKCQCVYMSAVSFGGGGHVQSKYEYDRVSACVYSSVCG